MAASPSPTPTPSSATDLPLLAQSSRVSMAKESDTTLDSQWARYAFLMNDSNFDDKIDIRGKYWSSANAKFTNTRIGGNIGVNARPQFTRYSDIRVSGRYAGTNPVSLGNISGNYGMGRYYSEAIDDPSQTIFLRFGVPQYNSLLSFFANAFSGKLATYVKTGRASSAWYVIGEAIGLLGIIASHPVLSLSIYAGRLFSTFFSRPSSKFYTLKPTMFQYWIAVNTLVNTVAVNRGILPRFMTDDQTANDKGKPFAFDKETLDQLHLLMPDVFTESYGIDVYRSQLRTQAISNHLIRDDFERENASGTLSSILSYAQRLSLDIGYGASHLGSRAVDFGYGVTHPAEVLYDVSSNVVNLYQFLFKKARAEFFLQDDATTDSKTDMTPKVDPNAGRPTGYDDASGSTYTQFPTSRDYFDAEFQQGADFAVFKVDSTGPVSESFSNSVAESDLSQKFNSTAAQTRETAFSFANGNIGSGFVAETIQSAVGAMGSLIGGGLSSITYGLSDAVISGLMSSGYIDIPKNWQSSSASLPRSTYTMRLISPYGNPISQLQNLYIPVCMILAGVLPRSVGKQSYSSPFLVQLFDRGRCQVQCGIIESVTITRGTSNLPFSPQGKPMAIDVSFSVMDMSSIMHMPISTGTLLGNDAALDEDNILMDYLAVLAGQDIPTQLYPMSKAKLNLAKRIRNAEVLFSPAYMAGLFHETVTSGLFKYLTLGGFNALEMFNRDNAMIRNVP